MGSVTKATPIHFIDSKNRIMKWRGRKTALSGYYKCVTMHTIFKPGARGRRPRAPGFLKLLWFARQHVCVCVCLCVCLCVRPRGH